MSEVRLIVATRSSGLQASQPVIKELPSSVVSGTPYINGGGGNRWNKKKRNYTNNVNMKMGFL